MESAVEDFSAVTVDADSTVIIGVKFVSTFVDWGDQSLVPNIGEDARAEDDCHGRCWRKTDEDDVKEFKYRQLEFVVCIF